MVAIQGSLIEHKIFPLSEDGHSLHLFVLSFKRCFRSCTFRLGIQSIAALNTGYSHWVATQSVTYRFTCIWVALVWMAASWTCLCISFSVSSTTGSWASALPVHPTVTPSWIDFTVFTSSLNITQFRTFVAALSHPFWYLMLKVNQVSDSIQQCWIISKLSVVMINMNGLLSVLTMNGFQGRNPWNCSVVPHFRARNSCLV